MSDRNSSGSPSGRTPEAVGTQSVSRRSGRIPVPGPVHNQRTRAPARIAFAALVAATACWGFGTVVSKQVVDDVAPLTLLPIQLAASSALLLVVTVARREPIALTSPVRRLAALGVLNP